MNRRIIIFGGIAVLVIIIIIVIVTIVRKPKEEQVSLSFWDPLNKIENFQPLIDEFKESYNVEIKYEKRNPSTYEVDSLNMIASRKGPDIWAIPNTWLPKHQDKLSSFTGLLDEKKENLAYYKETFPEIVSEDNIFNNQIYGLPLGADPLVLFYNSGLFDEARGKIKGDDEEAQARRKLLSAPPANWEELKEIVQLTTQREGSEITLSGIAIGTDKIAAAPEILTLLMLQNGAQMTTRDHQTVTLHTALNKFGGEEFPAAAALDFYASFARSDKLNYSFDDAMGAGLQAFAAGKAAMYLDFASKEPEIKKLNNNLDFEIAPLPQKKNTENPLSYISYLSYTVPEVSSQKDWAWFFISFLADKERDKAYLEQSNNYPIRLDQIEASSKSGAEQIKIAANWYNPDPPVIDKLWRSVISQVLAGASSQTALEGAALEVKNLLQTN